MNILYCGDKNIEDGLIISILSLQKNVKENLNIYVLTIENEKYNIKSVTDKCIETLDKIVKQTNQSSFVKKFDITELFVKEVPVINMDTRFTPCCMLRLFADKIKELPDKILYLDNDVVCRKDCTKYYNQDITDYEIVRNLRLLWKMVF